MVRKMGLGLLWVGFVIYAIALAPPAPPDTLALLQDLATGHWSGINPLIIALFNLMGIWPLVYGGLLFVDGRDQTIPAWPFAAASFAVGAFALLPYLALRAPPSFSSESTTGALKFWDSRWLGRVGAVGAIVLLVYGLLQGNWADFGHQWQTSRFIHVMSLDFCALSLLFPVLLRDDMARRGLSDSPWFWPITLVPLLGPLIYLSVRPSLT